MARRIICASWLALAAAVSWGQSAAGQYAYPPPPAPAAYPPPGAAAPYSPPAIDAPRRQVEQLWYAGQNAYHAPAQAPPYSAGASPGYVHHPGPAAPPHRAAAPPLAPAPYAAPQASYSASPPAFGAPAPGQRPATPYMATAPTPATPGVDGYRPPPHAQQHPEPQAPGELFEAAQVVAVVGDEHILAGDVLPMVNQWIEANREKIPPGREEYFRQRIMEQFLESEIQNRLIYLDFVRQLRAKGAGPERVTEIHNRLYQQFDEKRLPDLMEKAQVATPVELDAKLREQGSSLMKHKRQFAQKVLSQQWLQECGRVDYKPVITHAQMLDYYYAQAEEYDFPAQARWEHLMVRFDKSPSKAAAWEAIAAMGNEVAIGGAPLWAVAKRSSHGVTASDGGQFDWTTKGSLRSKVLDQAIFSLPLNELSGILEDEDGFHIVRVLERREAGRTPFEKAQTEIKETLRKEQVNKQIEAYLADLRQNTSVWTIFDEEKKQRQQQEAVRNSSFRG